MDKLELARQIDEASNYLSQHLACDFSRAIFIILGSGFHSYVGDRHPVKTLSLSDIPHVKSTKVSGHGSELVLLSVDGSPVLVQTGRLHLYEGHTPHDVVFTLRVIHQLGVRKVLLTNASGSVTTSVQPGQVMVIKDHINLTGQNCLIDAPQANGSSLQQFVDMVGCYDPEYSQLISQKMSFAKAIYAGVLGPTYETPAETAMIGRLGADIVGMSTVQEAIAAKHLGMRTACLSLVTNMAGGLSSSVDHKEVLDMSRARSSSLKDAVNAAVNIMQTL